jgi:light-harvesting complex I chlorophyll a/b binding protein 1
MVFSTSTAFQWQMFGRSVAQARSLSQCMIRSNLEPSSFEPVRDPLLSKLFSNRDRDDEFENELEYDGLEDDINFRGINKIDHEGDIDVEKEFILKELAHLESLQGILSELEEYNDGDDQEDDDDDDDLEMLWDQDSLNELFGNLTEDETEFDVEAEDDDQVTETKKKERVRETAAASLENALLQGVVPVSAGVGSDCLPGDWGFDPLNLATKDYFHQSQTFLLNLLPGNGDSDPTSQPELEELQQRPRPRALILRDYREAEIRHGRLAMLAAIFWPLQEMLDRLLLDKDQFGPLIYGPITLPYFPLLMTAIMLLLGYLDIYSQAIKDMDKIGEAFLPGDCFWDPLKILQGATDLARRNMQERELFNGRVAMLAVALFTWEEAITHLPVISVGANDLLFLPAYQVPFIQEWLDERFLTHDPESAFSAPREVYALNSILNQVAESSEPSSLN